MRLLDTLMMCPACGRWWKYREQHQDADEQRFHEELAKPTIATVPVDMQAEELPA